VSSNFESKFIIKHPFEKKMANFTQNQLVWAKVKGYPWWPAIVTFLHNKSNKKGD